MTEGMYADDISNLDYVFDSLNINYDIEAGVESNKQTIQDVCSRHMSRVVYDTKLIAAMQKFRISWMNKSDDYSEFLGGSLLGIHDIKFSLRDEETVFNDIFEVDNVAFKLDILELDEIDKSWKVTTNPYYHMIMYSIHKYTTGTLSDKVKDEAITELYLLFAYKVIGSILSHFFKYNIDKSIAMAVYESLSNRYLIKRYKNWQEVFEHRSNDFKSPNGLHANRMKIYTTEDSIRVINDAQGRLKEAVKNIYKVMIEVKESGDKVSITSIHQTIGEDDNIKDITMRPDIYFNYLNSIRRSQHDYIKVELINIIGELLPNIEAKNLKDSLTFISISGDKNVEKMMDKMHENTLFVGMEFLKSRNIINNYNRDISNVLDSLKRYWSSSKVNVEEMKEVKKFLTVVVKKATGRVTKWMIATTVIGIVLYIYLRAFAKDMYK
jgi:hypothetical protein